MNGTTNFLTAVLLLLPSISFADEPFRPVPGVFAPMEKAHTYCGELVLVDHANRRGSIRVEGSGMFFRNSPHPFAMLPYGMIRRHGAPSDLRDIPFWHGDACKGLPATRPQNIPRSSKCSI